MHIDIAETLHVGVDELLSTQLFLEKSDSIGEIQTIIQSCTPAQARILLDILKAAKNSLDENM